MLLFFRGLLCLLVFLIGSSELKAEGTTGFLSVKYLLPLNPQSMLIRELVPSANQALLRHEETLFTSSNDKLLAIDRFSGSLLYDVPVSGSANSCLLLADHVLYGCTDQGQVTAWSITKKEILWRVQLDEPLGEKAFVQGVCLFLGAKTGSTWCLDPLTGIVQWKISVEQQIQDAISPVVRFASDITADSILIWRSDGELMQVRYDPLQYRVSARYTAADTYRAIASPIVVGNNVLVPSRRDSTLSLPFGFSQRSQPGALPLSVGAIQVWSSDVMSSSSIQKFVGVNRDILDFSSKVSEDTGSLSILPESALDARWIAAVMPFGNKDSQTSVHPEEYSDALLLNDRGQFWYGGQRIKSPWMKGVASPMIAAPGRKPYSRDIYFISKSGWLYRFNWSTVEGSR